MKYHHECKREYLNKVSNAKSNSTLEQSVYNIRKSTFEDIISYITETVARENKPQFASDILDRYKQRRGTQRKRRFKFDSTSYIQVKINS